ncbi:site-specific DNA-methyltransferase [Moraxella pluranimalium]|uniref:site-specific DNA-methyltransferase n=1 Tax=Moraxella pluranimalium TaxID=470453 RepID=UPI0022448B21|nr:site-specific DNA-methyltransferase [Moraxella pluranimalium]
MYPRLYVARELLREDGVIFISIDDNEQAQLKILCDEVFGEENFEGHIHWRRRHNQPNDKTKMIGLVAEHILCYAKNSQYYKTSGVGKLPLTGRFSNPDNDPRGDWATKPWKTGSDQTGTTYSITTPTGKVYIEEWMGEYETFDKLLKDNRIIFTNNGDGLPRKKYFKFEREEEGQCATNWWEHTLFGHNQLGSQELTDLFGQKNIFSNPKNTTLIKSLIAISNAKNNDFVLDFFAGSGTTAHTVKQLNRENQDLNLRYICIQLPENLDEALKTASAENKKIIQNAINWLEKHQKPHNLFEITKARIELAAVKIHAENPDYSGDLGFKIFETVPNFQAALTDDFNPQQADLPDTKDTALSDEQLHTLLTTWRVYDGCRLPEKVQAIDLAGYTAYYCRQHLYLLASGFHSECVKALIEKLDNDKDFVPGRIVLFSQNMDSAIQKELAQAVKTYANKKGLNNLSVLARVF